MSWNEGEVVSETENIHPSVEVESSVNICKEPGGTIIEHDHGKAKICANCDDLARKATRLQKKKVIPCLMLKVRIVVKQALTHMLNFNMADIQDFVGNDEGGDDMDWQLEEKMSQPEEENGMA
ncbi:Hypothetical predicted protein [Paramuricea clavata]|uniref:Uncharacterized protein n=1 Tax=Paramuricea clavata TaxID=317549 RepID=A0A7D9I565_PARCT|nr:Hypothetical predicted protein [Paramuricea clavata]